MSNYSEFKNQLIDHQLMKDAHYAMISTFYDGSSKKYICYFQEKINELGNGFAAKIQKQQYKNIINFVIANIPPIIKWKKQ